MKLFIDSANVVEIKEAVKRGFLSGITTNPTLISKERRDQLSLISEIVSWSRPPHPTLHVSVEPTTDEMLQRFLEIDQRLVMKVPISWDNLDLVKRLHEDGIRVNVTACMTFNQALMAASAGADYVSLFWNRIKDHGTNPNAAGMAVWHTRQALNDAGKKTEIIVGSIRAPDDVEEAFNNGAHIVTVPPHILKEMCKHPKTDEIVAQFERDAKTTATEPSSADAESRRWSRPLVP